MSTVKTNNVQVGQSLTATNNFTLYQPTVPDGTVRLGVGNTGATTADVASFTSAGLFQFNSGYGSVATAYGCRAWVNFNGTANSNISGTYSQSGTAITVTATNHGLSAGQSVYLTFSTGSASAQLCTVASVTNANVFVATSAASLSTSGNCTLNFQTIRASGNVSSITDNGTSDYTVNFTTAMPDANYGISGTAGLNTTSLKVVVQPSTLTAPTTTAVRIQVPSADGSLGSDPPFVCVSVFR